jgi:hypothetical protein
MWFQPRIIPASHATSVSTPRITNPAAHLARPHDIVELWESIYIMGGALTQFFEEFPQHLQGLAKACKILLALGSTQIICLQETFSGRNLAKAVPLADSRDCPDDYGQTFEGGVVHWGLDDVVL